MTGNGWPHKDESEERVLTPYFTGTDTDREIRERLAGLEARLGGNGGSKLNQEGLWTVVWKIIAVIGSVAIAAVGVYKGLETDINSQIDARYAEYRKDVNHLNDEIQYLRNAQETTGERLQIIITNQHRIIDACEK